LFLTVSLELENVKRFNTETFVQSKQTIHIRPNKITCVQQLQTIFPEISCHQSMSNEQAGLKLMTHHYLVKKPGIHFQYNSANILILVFYQPLN